LKLISFIFHDHYIFVILTLKFSGIKLVVSYSGVFQSPFYYNIRVKFRRLEVRRWEVHNVGRHFYYRRGE